MIDMCLDHVMRFAPIVQKLRKFEEIIYTNGNSTALAHGTCEAPAFLSPPFLSSLSNSKKQCLQQQEKATNLVLPGFSAPGHLVSNYFSRKGVVMIDADCVRRNC